MGSHITDQFYNERKETEAPDLSLLIRKAYEQLTEEPGEVEAADPQLKAWLESWFVKKREAPVNLFLSD